MKRETATRIIAVNREVPLEFVEHFADINKQFVEVLLQPKLHLT